VIHWFSAFFILTRQKIMWIFSNRNQTLSLLHQYCKHLPTLELINEKKRELSFLKVQFNYFIDFIEYDSTFNSLTIVIITNIFNWTNILIFYWMD
jgi:hypothetical protein